MVIIMSHQRKLVLVKVMLTWSHQRKLVVVKVMLIWSNQRKLVVLVVNLGLCRKTPPAYAGGS
ncbi:hypothetical protein [Thermopirellula anaerolimosa]